MNGTKTQRNSNNRKFLKFPKVCNIIFSFPPILPMREWHIGKDLSSRWDQPFLKPSEAKSGGRRRSNSTNLQATNPNHRTEIPATRNTATAQLGWQLPYSYSLSSRKYIWVKFQRSSLLWWLKNFLGQMKAAQLKSPVTIQIQAYRPAKPASSPLQPLWALAIPAVCYLSNPTKPWTSVSAGVSPVKWFFQGFGCFDMREFCSSWRGEGQGNAHMIWSFHIFCLCS